MAKMLTLARICLRQGTASSLPRSNTYREMKNLGVLLIAAALLLPAGAAAQRVFKYRVYFKDKKESPYSKRRPQEFLSQKAIARRAKWHLKIDDRDLPVSPKYVREIAAQGVKVLCVSKWNNTALVQSDDSLRLVELASLPFVNGVSRLFHATLPDTPDPAERFSYLDDKPVRVSTDYYGIAQEQITMLGGDKLHNLGFRGKGMTIAIIDGGFNNADTVSLLNNVRILGNHNFVRPERSVFTENEHGTNVLSCMGANKPGVIVGTAPDAEFWLLQSEDGYSETPAEEDTWAAALEFADSVGADVVNSSLGYNLFDDSAMNVMHSELDGITHLISRSASLAASRGILVVNSAGNSGDEPWRKIGIPADGRDMLSVGAVYTPKINAFFTSVGFSADGRVKPDVSARGIAAGVVRKENVVGYANGTSFSSPITAGMAACLMQALPRLKPVEIIDLLHRCGDRADNPDNIFGYGVPDYYKAYKTGRK